MSQAKTLSERELKQVLGHIALHRHATRNRVMLLMTHYAGMRVGEVAALRIGDIWTLDGGVANEIHLNKDQTKGNRARTVYLPEKLRKELIAYLATIDRTDAGKALFRTQQRSAFSANTLCQHFHYLYKDAGIIGASSHSGRRSFATKIAEKGVSVRTLQQLLGHSALSSTMVYVDCNDDMKRRAVELV